MFMSDVCHLEGRGKSTPDTSITGGQRQLSNPYFRFHLKRTQQLRFLNLTILLPIVLTLYV